MTPTVDYSHPPTITTLESTFTDLQAAIIAAESAFAKWKLRAVTAESLLAVTLCVLLADLVFRR